LQPATHHDHILIVEKDNLSFMQHKKYDSYMILIVFCGFSPVGKEEEVRDMLQDETV
jgi:hypothetical protein